MVLVKRGKIFHLFILRKIEHENVIDDILDRKKPFQTIKTLKTVFFLCPKFTITDEKNRRKKQQEREERKEERGKSMVVHNFTLTVLEILAKKALPREELCLTVTYLKSSYINFRKFFMDAWHIIYDQTITEENFAIQFNTSS